MRFDSKGAKMNNTSLKIRRALCYLVLILISALCLFWFLLLFVNTTKSHGELGIGFSLVPSKYLFQNMYNLFHGALPVLNGLVNSFIVAGSTAALCTYFSSMTAYAIHAYDFPGKKIAFSFILGIMMIPTQVTALGFIKLIGGMGLEDHFTPLIIPASASPNTFFYMKQYMDSVLSRSLLEAARIDGAGEIRIFNTMVIPLVKPAIAVQMIFSFVSSWNNYFTPALILHEEKKKTLPVLIAELRSTDWLKFDMGQVYAMITFSILPVIIVYLILSKYIVGGVTLGGVKE